MRFEIEIREESYKFDLIANLKLVELENIMRQGYAKIYATMKDEKTTITRDISKIYINLDYETLKKINKELTIKIKKELKKSKYYKVSQSPFLPRINMKFLSDEAVKYINELVESERFKNYIKLKVFDELYNITNFLFRYLINDLRQKERISMFKFGINPEFKKEVKIKVI